MPELPIPPAAPVGRLEGPHRSRAKIARLPVLGVVVALLAVGVVVGRADSHTGPVTVTAATGPVAAPTDALSSSWFCAGATGGRHSDAPGDLVLTNAGPHAVTGRVTILGTDGGTRTVRVRRSVTVGADDRATVYETLPSAVAWTGAIVAFDGGGVSVEQQTVGPLATTATPCATTGSAAWYFATGATLVNASSEISILNPYPTPAIANLLFTTNEGQESPQQFSGITVPADGLVAVDLGTHLRRRSAIATAVTTSYGRVVAWKTDIVSPPRRGTPIVGTRAARAVDADPASPILGVTVTLGAPSAADLWRWPEGSAGTGVGEQFVIYNPGTRTADLALAVDLDDSTASAEPFDLTVGPEETTTITTGAEARIPSGSGYSVTLRSTNGVPVVAERTVAETAPYPARGVGETLGATRTASAWLLGAGAVSRHGDEQIAVSDPSTGAGAHHGAVTVTFQQLDQGRLVAIPASRRLGRGPTVGPVRLAAGRRVVIDLGRVSGFIDSAILVRASGPVVVERDLLGRAGTRGVSLSLGVPLAP